MAPWFFDLFGIRAQGAVFETVFWLMIALAGGLLLWRERHAGRKPVDTVATWVVAGTLLVFGLVQLGRVQLGGTLFFGTVGLRVPTYGVMMATGLGLSILLSFRDAERTPAAISGPQLIDIAFIVLVGGIVGSRVLYMITELPTFHAMCVDPLSVPQYVPDGQPDCLAVLRFWEGGLVWYGGFLGGIAAGAWWCRKHDASFAASADIIVPYMPFGHALGRLGCLGAGCCYGSPCDVPWAVTYPAGSDVFADHLDILPLADQVALHEAGHSLPVHPVQLYESFGEIAIFFFLVLWLRPRRRFAGQLTLAWMALYSALRIVTEVFRGDTVRGFVVEVPLPAVNRLLGLDPDAVTVLSTSQAISLGVMAAAVVATVVLLRRQRRAPRYVSGASA